MPIRGSAIVAIVAMCATEIAAAQSRIYLARTETCTPTCSGTIMTIAPDTLAIDAVTTVPAEIDSQPYLTPDGRLLIWFAGTYAPSPASYRFVLYDVASRTTAISPWPHPVPAEMVGNPRRPEVYFGNGGSVVALSASGPRVIPAAPECQGQPTVYPRQVSADGRRLLAACLSFLTPLLPSHTYVVDLDENRVVWHRADAQHRFGILSADGRFGYWHAGFTITSISLDDDLVVAAVTAPGSVAENRLHVDPQTGRLLVIGSTEARVFAPGNLAPVATWPMPFAATGSTDIASVALDSANGRLFMASGSNIGSSTPYGAYHVISAASGAVAFAASTGTRGRPDVGWFVAAPVPPAPTSLVASVTGNAVTLSWAAAPTVITTTRYVLEVGSAPGRSDITSGLDLGAPTSFSAGGVPPGAYYVRVRAANYTGTGAPSNEVIVTVP